MPKRLGALMATLLGAACTAVPAADVPPATPADPVTQPQPAGPALGGEFVLGGEMTQGGFARGRVPAGTVRLELDGEAVPVSSDGQFFVAFDRDADTTARLVATGTRGDARERTLAIAPRAWDIERVDVARSPGGASEAFMALRRPELDRIAAARASDSGSEGWRQDFIWPVEARISGRFGSQRIYRGGEAGAYHSGIDIAPGAGAAYVAPADGVVVLAAESPFTLEGNLLIVDHGNGLNSAFLHSQALAVKTGDRVRQGQRLGTVGMTGRATGPHLHWSLMWRGRRLDPLLFTGPMG